MRKNTLLAGLCGLALGVSAAAAVPTIAAVVNAVPGKQTSPSVTIDVPQFAVGQALDNAVQICSNWDDWYNQRIPMVLSWSATPGVVGYDIYQSESVLEPESSNKSLIAADITASSYNIRGGNYASDCGGSSNPPSYEVVAKTFKGAFPEPGSPVFTRGIASVWASYIHPNVWQENGLFQGAADAGTPLTVTRTGSWRTSTCTCFNGGTTSYATAAGASTTYTVQTTVPDQYVAIVVEKASNRGRATMQVDGASAGTMETYSATTTHRVIGWQARIATPGVHTVKVINQATSGRPRVDIDSVLLSPPVG